MIKVWRGLKNNPLSPLEALLSLCDSLLKILPSDAVDARLTRLYQLTTAVQKEALAFQNTMAEQSGLKKLGTLGLSANARSLPISDEGLFKAFMDALYELFDCVPKLRDQFYEDVHAGFGVIRRNDTWCCLRVGEATNQARPLSHRGRIALDRAHLDDEFLKSYRLERKMLDEPPRLSRSSFLVASSARTDPPPPNDGADAASGAPRAARL